MPFADSSNSLYVAILRHIQTMRERKDLQNPDTLARNFLSFRDRWRARIIGRNELQVLRQDPFYYYLVARTRYYDEIYGDAVRAGVVQVANIGCGADTRPYRFRDLLTAHGVRVLECDLPEAIAQKRRVARRWRGLIQVDYMPIDLNDGTWPEFGRFLAQAGRTLIVMEGVSPYIDEASFTEFLRVAARFAAPGSLLAYDYKLTGVRMEFGRSERIAVPFRLPADLPGVIRFHEALGMVMVSHESGPELCARLLPGGAPHGAFDEDALIQLRVAGNQVDG